MARDYHFKFTVLGRYPAHLKGNPAHVTVNMAAGRNDHIVHSGTLTMSEEEWGAFLGALQAAGNVAVDVDEGHPPDRR